MGFSTSAVFFLLFTSSVALGLEIYSLQVKHFDATKMFLDDRSVKMKDEIHTFIKIIKVTTSGSSYYDFATGRKIDKWAARKADEPVRPPSTGPFISGETEFSNNEYVKIGDSDNVRVSTDITTGSYATHHFIFTIDEDPSDIYNLSVLWEGYGTQNPSYLYIWNYASNGWELVGVGYSTNSDNILVKDFIVGRASISDYIDSSGYLHLVVMSYESGGNRKLNTDYVRVAVTTGGVWVQNTGDTILDPDYLMLFHNGVLVSELSYTASVDGGYWEPGEVVRLSYNPKAGDEVKIVVDKGVSDVYRVS